MPREIGVNLHPWLAATAPVLLLAAVNISQIETHTLTLPIVFSLLLATLVFLLARPMVKTWQGAAVMATLGMACFFAHGHVLSVLPLLRGDTGHGVLIAVSLTAMAVLAGRLRKEPARGPRFSRAVFPFVAAFFVLSLGQFTWAAMRGQPTTPRTESLVIEPATDPTQDEDTPAAADLPDIYYIVLDGYARADRLEKDYGFDNSAFLDCLRSEGFFIADESRSNYAMTFLSLASSLNMRYLDDEAARLGPDATSRHDVYGLIKNNLVGRYLQAKGYHFVHINTGWGGTENSAIADSAYPETIAEFHDVLLGTTMLEPLADELGTRHAGLIKKQLASIAGPASTKQATTDQPRFVFAHLICPHPPFCFDKDGNQKLLPTEDTWNDRKGYVDQVQFMNTRMKQVVAEIKRRSARPPVILIQADHGTASRRVSDPPESEQPDLIRERMPILNAYLVPPACREQLYPGITPVNTFRLLLSSLFEDAQLEPLEDRSFFSWYERPYDFVDVTEVLDAGMPSQAGL